MSPGKGWIYVVSNTFAQNFTIQKASKILWWKKRISFRYDLQEIESDTKFFAQCFVHIFAFYQNNIAGKGEKQTAHYLK